MILSARSSSNSMRLTRREIKLLPSPLCTLREVLTKTVQYRCRQLSFQHPPTLKSSFSIQSWRTCPNQVSASSLFSARQAMTSGPLSTSQRSRDPSRVPSAGTRSRLDPRIYAAITSKDPSRLKSLSRCPPVSTRSSTAWTRLRSPSSKKARQNTR